MLLSEKPLPKAALPAHVVARRHLNCAHTMRVATPKMGPLRVLRASDCDRALVVLLPSGSEGTYRRIDLEPAPNPATTPHQPAA